MTRLAIAIALLAFAVPARAECVCSEPQVLHDDVPVCPATATVTCDAPRFERIVFAVTQAEFERDRALAANKRLEAELAARIAQEPVESFVSPGVAFALGVGVASGVAVVVVVALLR